MKKTFYFSALLLILFEIANVYFIMPMPGSQEMNSIDIAYFLYTLRWVFRIGLGLFMLIGFIQSWNTPRKIARVLMLIPVLGVVYLFNFVMVADKMFLQPSELILKSQTENKVPLDRVIIGIVENGEAKAYPVEYLAYHHQVQDKIGGKDVIVTYCSVCRSGRVFEPMVSGKPEKFRLVGMDHFNALFEDGTTGSWWRQENGEAITGDMKGRKLPEFSSFQMSLEQWLKLYPSSLIMQPDPASVSHYDPDVKFETGESTSQLVGTNHQSWENKSWVVGIQVGDSARAYDWNDLKEKRIINDSLNGKGIFLVLGSDNKSFAAFERPKGEEATFKNDTIFYSNQMYDLSGRNLENDQDFIKHIPAHQEFWHSWKTFHPQTSSY